MAIDDSDSPWKGTEPGDIDVFLAEFTSTDAYLATSFRPVACACGSSVFRLERSRSLTRRTCTSCAEVRYISRGGAHEGYWAEAIENEEPVTFCCAGCGGDEANLTVGFAGYPEKPKLADGVKWFYVGLRCIKCGGLCCFNDGKVGRTGSATIRAEVTGEIEGE
jgi:hypothetical protein